MKRKKRLDVSASATPQTLEYIASLCAYKRTHIRREKERLAHLELMLEELTQAMNNQ